MKTLITLIAVLVGLQTVAQNIPPQAINFQGVAIDKTGIPVPGMDELGNPIQNSGIKVRFSILEGTATGTLVYREFHNTTTDEFGRFNVEIGRGSSQEGLFESIQWGNNRHFLKVEVDLDDSGTNFILASVQEFLSVPYALYAKASGLSENDLDTDPNNEIQTLTLSGNLLEISGGNSVNLPANTDNQTLSISGTTLTISGGNSITIPDNQTLTLTGNSLSISNGNTVNLPSDSDNQTLSLSGSILGISNGNNITLPTLLDNDTANELQTLSIINGSLSISNGNTVTLPPDSDNQTLTLSGNTLNILNGNSIALPTSLDNDSTNELQTLSLNNDTLSISNGNNIVIPVNTDNQTLSLNGSNLSISGGNTISLPQSTDSQTLSISGTQLSISNGNNINLPISIDNDTTNEIQTLSFNNGVISISKGNNVTLPTSLDNDPTNELQTISINGSVVSLSNNGGSIVLPTDQVNDADADPINEIQVLSYANDTLRLSKNGGKVYYPQSKSFNYGSGSGGSYDALPSSQSSFVIPNNVTEIQLVVWGSNGGDSGCNCAGLNWSCWCGFCSLGTQGRGGEGLDVAFRLKVNPGDTVKFSIGSNGVLGQNTTQRVQTSIGGNGDTIKISINNLLLLTSVGGKGGISGSSPNNGTAPGCGSTGQQGTVYFFSNNIPYNAIQFNLSSLNPYGLIDFQSSTSLSYRGVTRSNSVLLLY